MKLLPISLIPTTLINAFNFTTTTNQPKTMNEPWIDRWNERYSKDEFAYGEQPNNYLKEQLEKLDLGSILFPAEGEGRNAVFAAKLGWTVSAFDISVEGKNKALRLAQVNKVTIDYQVGDLQTLNYNSN